MIRHLKIRQQLILICLAFSLLIAILLYLLVAEKNIAINFAEQEMIGTAYLPSLRKLMELLPAHDRAAFSHVSELSEARKRIDEAFEQLESVDRRYAATLKSSEKMQALKVQWQELKEKEANLSLEERENRHRLLASGVLGLVSHVGDTSNLILDPDLDSFYMMDAVVIQLPNNQDLLAQVLQTGAAILSRKEITAEEKTQLVVWNGLLKSNLENLTNDLKKAEVNNPSGSLQAIVGPSQSDLASIKVLIDLMDKHLIGATEFTLTPQEFTAADLAALNASFHLWDAAVPALNELLAARIGGFNQKKYTTIGGCILAVLLVSLGAAVWLSVTVSKPLTRVVEIADQLARGVLPDKLAVNSSNETGQLITAMNTMTDYLRGMADVADQLAIGDLSANVEPRSAGDRFGNSFKRMIGGLRSSISQIDQGAGQVASTSSQIAAASEQSRHSAQILSSSSEEITATIHEMVASIRQVSLNAKTQNRAVTETSSSFAQMVNSLQGIAGNVKQLAALTASASDAAQAGQRTLAESNTNMQRINVSVDAAGRTINSLGTWAERIGKLVETISELADQTNLLALNAAIEAARAGEHGLGFAVVADEVRKLAERSARSTKEISEIIEAIQRESRAAVAQMEESNQIVRDHMAATSVNDMLQSILLAVERIVSQTREIESSTAKQSDEAEEIAIATQNLIRLTQEITAAAEEQSTGAAEVEQSMEQLRDLVRQATGLSQDLHRSAESLDRQSGILSTVVGRFRTGDKLDSHQLASEEFYPSDHSQVRAQPQSDRRPAGAFAH